MKRLIAFTITILTAVCFVACTVAGKDKTTKPNGLSGRFQAAVSITLDELNADGTIKRFGDGMWEVEFTSPNTLSGVKLAFNEGNVDASYKGLNFSVPQSALPVKSMMLNLIAAADDLAKNEELTGVEEDGVMKITGLLDGGEYILTVDKNGEIKKFEMPNNKLVIVFSEVVALAEENNESTEVTEAVSQEETIPEETAAEETVAESPQEVTDTIAEVPVA